MEPQDKKSTRKENVGVIISNKMTKTVTVKVTHKLRHAKYRKIVERSKKMYAHDESNTLEVGQKVRIRETRPLSKLKRWNVVEVL